MQNEMELKLSGCSQLIGEELSSSSIQTLLQEHLKLARCYLTRSGQVGDRVLARPGDRAGSGVDLQKRNGKME